MLNIDDRLIKEVSPKIRPNALSVLLAIAIHLNQKTNRCFPSHERLMQLTGMGKNAVYDALNVLKDGGLLLSEQPIDSKTKKFGRRTFRLTTRFIKIFVDAQDAEPLPESREPESREPESREPESRETYQLNNGEQINEEEQINQQQQSASAKGVVGVEDEKEKKETFLPPAAPHIPPETGEFRRVDIDEEIDRLKNDDLAKEAFSMVYKLPAKLFLPYTDLFRTHAKGRGETYWKPQDLRSHFFSWAAIHFQKTPATTPQPRIRIGQD